MKISDLVRFKDHEQKAGLGIIMAIKESTLKSGNVYTTYLIYWLETGFKSTHGSNQLELLNSEFRKEKDYL